MTKKLLNHIFAISPACKRMPEQENSTFKFEFFKLNSQKAFFSLKQVIFLTNKSNVEFHFENFIDMSNFVFILPKIKINSINQTFFLQYTTLSLKLTNELCKLAGFEPFYSVIHMEITKKMKERLIYINEYPQIFFKMYFKYNNSFNENF